MTLGIGERRILLRVRPLVTGADTIYVARGSANIYGIVAASLFEWIQVSRV